MQAKVVECYPRHDSLESIRGILTDRVLILPDTLCPGEVVVRLIHYLGINTRIVEIGEIEISIENLNKAFDSHAYNVGWFGGTFRPLLAIADQMKAKGS